MRNITQFIRTIQNCISLMYNIFQKFFDNIKDNIDTIPASDEWVGKDDLLGTFDKISKNFDDQYNCAFKDIEYIFSDNKDVKYQTEKTVELLRKWKSDESSISIFSLVAAALTYFDFSLEEDEAYITPVLMAAALADVPNVLDYHNNFHFRKVVFHTIRMISVHNDIWGAEKHYLDKRQISLLISAAAVHDLGHKGDGNIIDRKYQMAKIERRSYDLAYPYFKKSGLSDDDLNDVIVMLTTTDVSPFGDPISPASQMRRAYEFHYGSSSEMDDKESLMLSDDLSLLAERERLCLMCLILHEADIMNSAAVDYDITCEESISVSKELGLVHALPEGTLLFLERICAGHMLSDAGRYLGSENLAVILERVMKDYKTGNKSYM